MSRFNAASTCAAFAAVLATNAAAQTPQFADLHRMLPWNGSVSSILSGDVDGDGDVDAFLALEAAYPLPGPTIHLFLNQGTGSFVDAPAQVPAAPTAGTPSARGDLDGDGDLDVLASGASLAEPIRLWLNGGSGTFTLTTGQVVAPPFLPRQIALGDLDGDGDLDALAANDGPETLLLNDGAGSLADASGLVPPATDDSLSVALGDLDGDGDLDALVGNAPCFSFIPAPDRLLLNDGSGGFSDASAQLPPTINDGAARSISFGDLDGDGDLDAAIGKVQCGYPIPVSSADTSIYWNNGVASFTSTILGSEGGVTTTVSTGDADGDGDLDVLAQGGSDCATESYCTYGSCVLYRNAGGGVFLPPAAFTGTSGANGGMAAADVDGDSDVDVLAGNFGRQTRLYLNDGAGTFFDVSGAAPDDSVFPWAQIPARALGVGDLDGDGDVDAVTTHDQWPPPSAVRLYRNYGTGLFANNPPEVLPFFALGTSIALGDLDGDADPDVLVGRGFGCTPDAPLLLLNTGAGTFLDGSGQLPPGSFNTGDVALGDVDGDGDLDALIGTSGYPPYSTCVPPPDRLYLNNGSAVFTDATGNLPAFSDVTVAVALADVDGDGDLDAFLANDGQPSRLYANDGTGVFSDATAQVPAGVLNPSDLAAGDVEGDGDVDLLIGDASGLATDLLYLNDGTGSFSDASGQVFQTPGATNSLALGDADADGDLDAYVGIVGPDRLLLNDGSGYFADSSSGIPFGGSSSRQATWADADSDGDSDVLLLDGTSVPRLRVLSNLSRQLTRRAVPRVGKPLTLDLYGPAWGAWFLAASPGAGVLPFPPLGTLRLDPAVLVFLLGGLLDGQGRAAPTFLVPAVPALVGGTIYWQALVVGPARLTNLEKTTFTNL